MQPLHEWKICAGCGIQFFGDPRKTRCKHACSYHTNDARAKRRGEMLPNFIGVDGEGYTLLDGSHRYTILSVGTETLSDPVGDQLRFGPICEFLWKQFLFNPTTTFIGFYLGYDFTQWFRTLPESRGYYLLHKEGIRTRLRRDSNSNPIPFPVRWNDWEFDILSNNRFKLRHRDSESWMYVCDTGSYFQTSFLNVINPTRWDGKAVCTQAEYVIIQEGKASRSEILSPQQWVLQYPSTIRYNLLENAILCRAMDRMASGLSREGVRLQRDQWFGPGQAAQKWLKKISLIPGRTVVDTTPREVLEAARASYYGGWFEIFAHGHLSGKTHEYDINSAYPMAMTTLPCLVHSQWHPGNVGNWVLVNAIISGSDPVIGVMPCRRKDGTIARPHLTEGWYWKHEIDASQQAGLIDQVNILESYSLLCSCTSCNPLARQIPDIYNRRLEAGKDTPHGKSLKLIYNSCYGKMAQSIGNPQYANPIYASLITAYCRTRILQAIATHPTKTQSLVMVATDGIYFREPHPGLPVHPEQLGAWDHKTKHDMTLFMPGVYWDNQTRDKLALGESPTLKSRGVNSNDLSQNIEKIDTAFHTTEWWTTGEWPQFDITLSFNLVSAKSAITRRDWTTSGTIKWGAAPGIPASRTISSNPDSKRCGTTSNQRTIDHRGDHRYSVYPQATPNHHTNPYNGTLGLPDTWPDTPDGPTDQLFIQAIQGTQT